LIELRLCQGVGMICIVYESRIDDVLFDVNCKGSVYVLIHIWCMNNKLQCMFFSGCSSGCGRVCSLQGLQCKITCFKLDLHGIPYRFNTSKSKEFRYIHAYIHI
jgi:hypothetical protein